ncbi:sodium-dependent transporter [Prochlorococcus marinus]|uniref:Na+-dependent transporters of the SNF family n=1 Tax=Prochlorococcus marinus (strain MIT 9211) TaxID=93059 RepID=A9BC04_PROM4|nr:sodium-dependent transporter [Prochlorococcus marinus]ABX09366.1 Na+-dependent transporters of the SNF family [Prochlorococcus marinus str. MIT 9211]
MQTREKWRSGLGFVLAAAGSAVGLGNLWGFAYRSSQGGGLAFLLLYILVVLVVCLPVLVGEMVLGRSTASSPFLAPVQAAGESWKPLGWLFAISSCGILSFYAVIMGWTADTFFHSLFIGLPVDMVEASDFFGRISSGNSVFVGQIISLVLTGSVVAAGVRGGIERLTRWAMPLLFVLLLILAIWATTLSGSWEGYTSFLFKWDPSQLLDKTTIRNAFTQAFFSLSLGIGIMVAYSSYLDKNNKLPKEALGVASFDTGVGLLAGMITFPIVMSFGLKDVISESTVGALFIALPTGFANLGLIGRLLAAVFFGLAFLAAITSSISLLEVPVSSMIDRLGWTRRKAVWISTFFVFLLGVPSAISLNFLGNMDAVFNVFLILGGFLISILMGWFIPSKYDQDLASSNSDQGVRRYLKFMIRWVSPPVIAFGLIVSVIDLVQGWFA